MQGTHWRRRKPLIRNGPTKKWWINGVRAQGISKKPHAPRILKRDKRGLRGQRTPQQLGKKHENKAKWEKGRVSITKERTAA